LKKISILFIVFALLTSYSFAQVGNIRGQVVDEEEMPLPGVNVKLTGPHAPRAVVTGEAGSFRFVNLPIGTYKVTVELIGFKTFIHENLIVRSGANIDLNIKMEIASLEEEVTVVATTPVVDTKKTTVFTTIDQTQLQEVPSARDPWVLLGQLPGVTSEVENVGGSQSGQQSDPRVSASLDDAYNVDGMDVSSSATGGVYLYFDYDSFEEVEVVTAGQDASYQSAGFQVNMVTRRGSNQVGGQLQFYYANEDLQGENRPEEVKEKAFKGDNIKSVANYGIQAGGPIIRDKLWVWLGYGVQDIKLRTIKGDPDNTFIRCRNAKVNWQISDKNRAEFITLFNVKSKWNRDASATRPPETTRDQTGPQPFLSFTDEHQFNDNFLMTVKIAPCPSWWQLYPVGGMEVQRGYDRGTGMYQDSWTFDWHDKIKWEVKTDGILFVENVLGGNHELKFGVTGRWLKYQDVSQTAGEVLRYFEDGVPDTARVYREGDRKYQLERYGIYLSDAYTKGRLTINLGLRFDTQHTTALETEIVASKIAPEVLPGVIGEKIDPGSGARWNGLSPRLGLAYDLTGDGRTVLRMSGARYVNKMSNSFATFVSRIRMAWAEYDWNDLNSDGWVQIDELVGYPLEGIIDYSNFDPWNPLAVESPNKIDADLKGTETLEFSAGIERELFTDFSLATTFLYRVNRRYNWDIYMLPDGTPLTQANWLGPVEGTLTYDDVSYPYEYWYLDQVRPAGLLRTNQPDYHKKYMGVIIVATKRLSNRWMIKTSATLQKYTRYYGDKAFLDPTNVESRDGQPEDYPQWQAKISFIYQLPYGINASAYANVRQGDVFDPELRIKAQERKDVGLGTYVYPRVGLYASERYETFYNVDFRLSKDFLIWRGKLTLTVDAFNALNFNHDIERYERLNSTRAREIEKILNPRLIRLGIRYRF